MNAKVSFDQLMYNTEELTDYSSLLPHKNNVRTI